MKQYKTIVLGLLCLALPLHADVKRESRHFLTTEAGIGYSALLNKSDFGKSSGLAGAKLQIGYEWNYRKFLLHTGVEFASINDRATVQPFQMQVPYTVGLPPSTPMVQHFDFLSYHDTQCMGQVNIPIQLGGWFANRYYFLVGARLGFPVLRNSMTKTQVRTYLTDPSLIGELTDVPIHDAYTSVEKAKHQWAGSINAQVSAEIGLVLNSFWEKPQPKGKKGASQARNKSQKKPILYRVGLFADYGVTGSVIPSRMLGEEPQLVSVAEPREMTFYPYINTATSAVNSLLVGAKFAVLFQLNEQKPPKALPSYFDIYIADATTSQPVASSLSIYDKKKKRAVTKEAKNGHLKYRAKIGDYTITASNNLYYPVTQDASIVEEDQLDTLRFALKARPWLRVRVTNTDTGEPLSVAVALQNAQTGDSVTTLHTAQENGLARVMLDDQKAYKLIISQTGYEAVERSIAYVGDSLNIGLTPIKVGKKVVLHNLFFATNKTRILPQSEPALDELYEFLRDNPSLVIRITGHTDNVGSDKANQILSEGRANAVRDEIIKRGIIPERIEAEGKGEEEPIADNKTEEGRAKNRRVEFTIISTGGADIEQIKE